MQSPHVISTFVFPSLSRVHACLCLAIPFSFRLCVHARLSESPAPPQGWDSNTRTFCFMLCSIDMPLEYVHLSYAVTVCHFRVCFHVAQSRSCMLVSSHPVFIPFLLSCSFIRIPSTLGWGLLMESILHHLAGRNVSS